MKLHMTKKKARIIVIVLAAVVVLAVAVFFIVRGVAHSFIQSEIQTREDWEIDTGDVEDREASQNVTVYSAPVEASIQVQQIVPDEYEDEGFTYYDESVQDRLAYTLLQLVKEEKYTLESPLAVLNPFGTGSNGLYLYFSTYSPTRVEYTVHVEDKSIPDYTATANNQGENGYSRLQEFLLIGLVPGMENTVTLSAVNRQGKAEEVSFTIDMPESTSGYDVTLETEDGESAQELSDGLYYAMGLGDYYGYTFFFDNSGVLRYEMVLEGYHSDRYLWDDDGSLITCVASHKIARINRFGQVTQVYDLGNFELHHDINWGPEGTILVLATDTEGETVEDQVLQVNLESGEVSHIVDFTQVLKSYFDTTRPVTATDPFFWSEGEWDWLHLNSLQYVEEDNAIIVSSRETSTIIKATLEEEPEIVWMAGNPEFWEGTEFEDCSLEQEGDFLFQYGQHDVELIGAEEAALLGFEPLSEGQYYLRIYDNNYFAMSSRDDFELEVPDEVSTSSTVDDSANSHVYFYRIDETQGTFTLMDSFDLPYSSLVSNAQWMGSTYVVNNGVNQCFEEYDMDGTLIRQYRYTCTANGYRVMKSDFQGFWFLKQDA